jgi:hypothetical protein
VKGSESKRAHEAARLEQIAAVVAGTAEVMGTELSSEALRIFVRALAPLEDATIRNALERTAFEIRGSKGFAPKLLLQDVLDRAGIISEAEADQMDAVLAWDMVERVVARYGFYNVDGDVVLRPLVSKANEKCERCGGQGWTLLGEPGGDRFVKDCVCRMREEVPEISQRIADTVRRLGGWNTLKDISQDRYPFVKREFIAEFTRWTKIESFRASSGGELVAVGKLTDGRGGVDLDSMLEKILRSQ